MKLTGSTCSLSQCSSLSLAKVSLTASGFLTASPKAVKTFLPWALTCALLWMAAALLKLPKLAKKRWVQG